MAEAEIKHIKTNGPHWEELTTVSLNSEGSVCAIGGQRPGGYDSTVQLYDPRNGKHLGNIEGLEAHATQLLFVDDSTLLIGHSDGSVSSWDIGKKKPKEAAKSSPVVGSVTSLALTDEGTLYVSSDAGSLAACSLPKLKSSKASFDWPEGESIHAITADPAGEWVAAAGDDGVIRMFSAEGGEPSREMPGHDGPIYSLILHPHERRLISAGEDCSIRLWYLQGEVEFEDRAAKQSHDGPIRCMKLGPTLKDEKGETLPPRLFTGSEDGSVKVWPLDSKRAPKTVSSSKSAVADLDWTSLPNEDGCYLFTVNPARVVTGWTFSRQTEPLGEHVTIFSLFHNLRYLLKSKKKEERKEALEELAHHLEDPQVFQSILAVLRKDGEQELRKLAVETIVNVQHRRPVKEIREALDDKHTTVRKAALGALRQLQGESAIAPLESGLKSSYEDLRRLAIQELVPLQSQSPHAARLIREALHDSAKSVQVAALDALEVLLPSSAKSPEPQPLLMALQVNSSALTLEVLYRIYKRDWSQLTELHAPLLQLLESDEEQLRRTAFLVTLSGSTSLFEALRVLDDATQRQWLDLEEQSSEPVKGDKKKAAKPKKPSAAEKKKALATLEAMGDEAKRPLLLGQSSRYADLALSSAILLARMGDLRAFGTLLQLSQEHDESVRQQTALGFRYLEDPRAEFCLAQLLNDSTKEVRDTAFDTLTALLDSSQRLAEVSMHSHHADIRHRALQQLIPGKKEKATDETVELIESALSDREESVRDEAFKILWSLFPKQPERVLLSALDAEEERMRTKAIAEIVKGFGKTDWGRDALLNTLNDPSWNIVQKAYEALRSVFPKDDITPQKAALSTNRKDLRLQALKNLQKAKKAELEPILLELIGDVDAEIRNDALSRMLSKYPNSNDTLAQALDVPHWDVKLTVAQHLAKRGDSRALEVASDYLEEEKRQFAEWENNYVTSPEQTLLEVLPETEQMRIQGLRRTILKVVLELGQPEGIEFIQPFLDDKSDSLASFALFVVAQCAGPEQRELLTNYLKHDNSQFQKYARSGLARLGDSIIVPAVTEQLRSGQGDQAIEALISLYALGDSSLPTVEGALTHSSSDVRNSAWVLLLANTVVDSQAGNSPNILLRAMSSEYPEQRLQAAALLQHWSNAEQLQNKLFEAILNSFVFAEDSEESKAAEKNKAKLTAELPRWIAGLTSEDSALRYASATILKFRNDVKKSLENLESRLRFWDKLALPKPKASKQDALPFVEMAFGAYAGLIRQNISNPITIKALDQAVSLLEHKDFALSNLEPLLEQALYFPQRKDVRKVAWQHMTSLYTKDRTKIYSLAIACPYSDVGLLALQTMKEETEKEARVLTTSALQSHLSDVRNKAAEQLQSLFPEDSLEPFILALQSDHSDVRLRVINRLLREDDTRVTDALRQALSSDHEDLRLKAATALAEREAPEAFDVLVEFLQQESHSIQGQAARAMLHLKSDKAVDVLINRFEDDPEETADKSLLVRTLGQLRNSKATDWLVQKLDHKHSSIRNYALEALAELAGPHEKRDEAILVPNMLRALDSKFENVQTSAVSYLSEIKHKDIQAGLGKLLRSRDEDVREAAINAILSRIPKLDKDFSILVEALDHPYPQIRKEAAYKLGELKEPKAFPVLFTTFQTSMEEYEQRAAIDALGKLGDSRAFPPILAMFPKDENVHPALESACEAVGRLAPDDRKQDVKQLLLGLILENKEIPQSLELYEETYDLLSSSHRSKAVVGLRHVAGDDGIKLLGQVARECPGWDGWEIRFAVAKELGASESKDAEPFLNELLNDDDSDVRREAANALLKLYDENDPTPHLKLFDNDNFEYEYELIEKATKVIAQYAEPVAILERLPLLADEGSDGDLFLDADVAPGDAEPSDIPYLDEEKTKVLTVGLLRRDPLPIESLLGGLKHSKLHVRMNTIQLLLEMLPENASDDKNIPMKTICKALQEANASAMEMWESGVGVRKQLSQFWTLSLWSLSTLQPKEAIKSAIAILNKEGSAPTVRAQAAQTLGMSGTSSKDAIQALSAAMKDTQEKVRRQAAWALSRIHKDSSTLLKDVHTLPSALRHLSNESGIGKGKAWSGLGNHASKREVVPTLVSNGETPVFVSMFEANKKNTTEQMLAIQALGRIADSPAIEHLDKWRSDDSLEKEVRVEAYRAWRRAKRRSEKRAS